MAKIIGVHTSGEVVGSVKAWTASSVPTNYLLCDGSAVSRTTYAALFAKIGITHGQGDGSTTFNLPNYQGRFLRGVDNAAGNDPDKASRTAMATGGATGNSVGSVQGHGFQSHNHTYTANSYWGSGALPAQAAWCAENTNQGSATATMSTAAASGGTSQATANETRPVNAYVNYLIAYK